MKPCVSQSNTASWKHTHLVNAASHAGTNHCHWELSDRAEEWEKGEITKTSVGVAFSLLSFCKRMQFVWTLLQHTANNWLHWNFHCCSWHYPNPLQIDLFGQWAVCVMWEEQQRQKEIHPGLLYQITLRTSNKCKPAHRRPNLFAVKLLFNARMKKDERFSKGRWWKKSGWIEPPFFDSAVLV